MFCAVDYFAGDAALFISRTVVHLTALVILTSLAFERSANGMRRTAGSYIYWRGRLTDGYNTLYVGFVVLVCVPTNARAWSLMSWLSIDRGQVHIYKARAPIFFFQKQRTNTLFPSLLRSSVSPSLPFFSSFGVRRRYDIADACRSVLAHFGREKWCCNSSGFAPVKFVILCLAR